VRTISYEHSAAYKEGSIPNKAKGNGARTERKDCSHEHQHEAGKDQGSQPELPMEASAMKKALVELGTMFGKVNIELGFAKKEMACGKLGPEDFSDISLLLRNIMLPIVGMTTFIDIIQFIKKNLSAKRLLGSRSTVEAVGKLETEE
jgi:Putative ER transporter, 6TM, N-terminal